MAVSTGKRPFRRRKAFVRAEPPLPPKPVKQPRPLAKHDRVTYALPYVHGKRVVALIDTAHKDGTVTVNACYVLDEQGNHEGGWLGYKYRINPTLLTRAA